jgi:hypothetical protein
MLFVSSTSSMILSIGSIAFGQGLPYAESNISNLLKNVVDAVARPEAMLQSMWALQEKQWTKMCPANRNWGGTI